MCKLAACHRYEALAFWSGGTLPCQIAQQPKTHQHGHTQPGHLTACCQLGTFYFIGGCLGSGGRAVVQSMNPAVRVLKCPWVRYWTQNCSQRHRHRDGNACTDGCNERADGKRVNVNHQNVTNLTPDSHHHTVKDRQIAAESSYRCILVYNQMVSQDPTNLLTGSWFSPHKHFPTDSQS